jgi:hypothetical protein
MIIDHPPRDADLPADPVRTGNIMARVRQVPAYGPEQPALRPARRSAWAWAGFVGLVLVGTVLSDCLGDVTADSSALVPWLMDSAVAMALIMVVAVVCAVRQPRSAS